MRLTVLAVALMPMAAYAQDTTLPAPTEPLAQSQSCPVGMVWSDAAGACDVAGEGSSPVTDLGMPAGCEHGAAREVMS